MNARELIEKLSPLQGRKIRITDVDGNEHEMICARVDYLPPQQREGEQGNVILCNGGFMPDGAPAGFTMMAKNALKVISYDHGFTIYIHPSITTEHVYIEVIE